MMNTIRIYVRLLDGTTAWVPVDAKSVADLRYQLLHGTEYDSNDGPLFLYEFFPGDIVETELVACVDGNNFQAAVRLIEEGQWPDRKYRAFKYKAAMGELTIVPKIAEFYNVEIGRVLDEEARGQFFYPSLMDSTRELACLIGTI